MAPDNVFTPIARAASRSLTADRKRLRNAARAPGGSGREPGTVIALASAWHPGGTPLWARLRHATVATPAVVGAAMTILTVPSACRKR